MIKIALSRLANDQLYTLGNRIKNLLTSVDATALGILLYVNLFLDKFGIYAKSYEKQSESAKKVSLKDSLRDSYFISLRSHLRNFRNHPSEEKRNKSLKLVKLLNKDGKLIYEDSYGAESASMESTIIEIELNHLADLELLFATEWYQLMKAAQLDFENTVREVNEQVTDRKLIASATKTRKALEDAMRKLFAFLPLHQAMTDSDELDELNREIQTEGNRF
jgi:hypothetical protein